MTDFRISAEDGSRPAKRKRALLEGNPPRNSWLKLIKTMASDVSPDEIRRPIEQHHRIERFCDASKTHFPPSENVVERRKRYLFLLLSIVHLKRKDSSPRLDDVSAIGHPVQHALHSRGFGNTVVHSEKGKFVVTIKAAFRLDPRSLEDRNSAPTSANRLRRFARVTH